MIIYLMESFIILAIDVNDQKNNSFINFELSQIIRFIRRHKMDFAFEPNNSNVKRCGCYALNPQLLKLYENHRILVPLRSCNYQIEIVNAMANVTLVQTYQNPIEQFLQVEYSFPISQDACVYRFVASFANTRIEGVVKQKQQAKKEYEKAVSEGKKAAYGEINKESKDIMNLKVGNIGPKQQVRIQIVYLQELSLSYNTFYQFHLPATITPRYANQIPNEHILAGYKKAPSQETFGTFNWTFQISLKSTRKAILHDSHTHKLQLISQNHTRTQSVFVLENPTIPNKDFIFSYTTEDYQLPNYVLGRTDKSSSVMLSFIPKFCSLNIDDAYKASIDNKTFQGDIDTARAEYIFLLDRSGSMSGSRITRAKQALILFIKSLPKDSYFNVISFGSNSASLFQSSRKYGNKDIDYAVKQVNRMQANMGGTQIYDPLFNLLKQKPIHGYPKQIFLLTDGGVSNTEGVLKMVGSNNKYARVHSIGIGNGASEALIIGCAKKGKGYSVFITDHEDPSQKIIQLLSDSLSAVISKMNLDFDATIVQSIIPNPKTLPYILKGEIVNFYITFKGQLSTKANFTFSYQDSHNKLPYASKIEIDPESANESFIDRMGHYKRIKILQESHSNNSQLEEYMFYVKKIDKKEEIIKESVEHQILSEFTAFICVQKELIDGKYEQIKQVGKVKVVVQNPPPIQFKKSSNSYGSVPPSVLYPIPASYNSMVCHSVVGNAMPQDRFRTLTKSTNNCQLQNLSRQAEKIESQSKAFRSLAKQQQKSSGGILNSFTSFFKNIFSKNQQQPKRELLQRQCAQQEDQQDEDQNEDVSLEQRKKVQYKQVKQSKQQRIQAPLQKNSNLINSIVSQQDSQGFWKNLSLITQLFNQDVQKVVKSSNNPKAIAAYLIAKWIEKYYPQKQYSLIVKKAMNYAKKQSNYKGFSSLYDKYIK